MLGQPGLLPRPVVFVGRISGIEREQNLARLLALQPQPLQLALAPLWEGFGLPFEWLPHFQTFAYVLLWIAALVTLWTGWQYFSKAQQKMSQI